jgi:hypothetical protein
MKTRSQRLVIVVALIMVLQVVTPLRASYAMTTIASQEAGAFSLPDGRVGQRYEYQLRTEGGLPPISWRVVGGELPPGIGLEANGRITGVPSAPRREAYGFVLEVSDTSQPSQRAKESYLLKIEAGPLRIISGASKLRIVPQGSAAQNSSEAGVGVGSTRGASVSNEKSSETTADNRVPSFAWPVEAPTSRLSEGTEVLHALPSGTGSDNEVDELNPARFVKIYEISKAKNGAVQTVQEAEIYGRLIYDHSNRNLRSTRLTADENSSLAIFPDTSGRNIAFNTIYMAAELSSADTKQNLEVMNYSEVGTAPSADAFIIGASFETARNIIDKLITLQRRSTDILKYVQPTNDTEINDQQLNQLIEIDAQPNAQDLRERARTAFDQYAPEIESICSFLLTETNRNIVERVANNVFNLDRDTLIAIAKQFSTDAALSHGNNDAATRRLLWRTVQVYRDFKPARAEIQRLTTRGGQDKPGQSAERGKLVKRLQQLIAESDTEAAKAVARDLYAYDRSDDVISNLRQTKFPIGWVSLEEARAKDGDTLKLTVRVQNPASAGTGNKVPFYIAVKQYGVKLHWASSFMFLKRVNITAADLVPDANGNALTDVNFAPSPGVSYGFTYFKRGEGGGSKFARVLAPTLGINVSFMNFKDPGFDLSTGMFTNTKGTDVQVGTGPIVSLFNNKLHFIPVGWNLNVDRKRRYWGIGFGFVEFAKELSKYIKK